MTMTILLLHAGFCLQSARAGSHRLWYFDSSLSGPLLRIPEFSEVGYVDDIPISSYTSESCRVGPQALWMEKITVEDPQYWERNTNRLRDEEQDFKKQLRSAMYRVNHTRGLHTYQKIYGCELWDDNSTRGFTKYAFDGQDFLSFDKDRLTWTAATYAAKITQDQWNSERNDALRRKDYLEGRCIEYLKKHLRNGKESLQKRPPKTRISQRKRGGRIFLTGYAYGFYPRDIEVKWFRNGVEMPWESRDILPNPDRTYQVRITVEVQEGNEENYMLQVDHSSLTEIVTLVYEEKSLPKAVIIAIVGSIVGVALLAAIISVLNYRSKASGRGPGGVGDVNQPLQQGENI
ncbi:major histocompatibility complex class I-related protein 1-like [Lissotriton helveticus]